MAHSTLVSPSEADKQYAKANNLVRPAIFFPVTAVIFLLLSGYIPGGIALFFSVYCLLLGIASAFLAVAQMLRRYDRWIVHVEGKGISIRPTLALVRVKQIALGIGIACAPIAIIIEVLVTHSAVGAVLSLITGLMFSTMFYFMFMSSPHRLWLIHQGPIIESLLKMSRSVLSSTSPRHVFRGIAIRSLKASVQFPTSVISFRSCTCPPTEPTATWSST